MVQLVAIWPKTQGTGPSKSGRWPIACDSGSRTGTTKEIAGISEKVHPFTQSAAAIALLVGCCGQDFAYRSTFRLKVALSIETVADQGR